MKFRLRTAIGESKRYYQHSATTPVHGTGQGSCASPALWLIISSILMDCLAQLGQGMTMQEILGDRTLQQWIDGFVDDTSLFTNLLGLIGDPNDVRLLTEKLRQDMLFWKELLEASGEKLELHKCFYYILAWKFDSKGHSTPMTITEQRHIVDQITIPESTANSPILISQKEVFTGHKILGCHKSVIGNEDNKIQYLRTVSDNRGYCIKNKPFTRKQTRLALNMIYFPSLTYGLPSTSLTFNQLTLIQRFAIDKFISGMGHDRSTPRSLIFGPKEFGGFGIRHLYTEMQGMKINSVISHL
jgi:hypothetical protein